ncbi:MAG: hypothetical protein K2Z81_02010, partial [Cyanobacteria bacterium]|nr:hypothetical protein [Cyanobacteriota bacterium]
LETQARQYSQQRRFDRAETALRDSLQCTGNGITPLMVASRQFMLYDACYGQNRRPQAIEAIQACLATHRDIARGGEPGSAQALQHLLYAVGGLNQINERPRALEALQSHLALLSQTVPGTQDLRIQAGSQEAIQILNRVADIYVRIDEHQLAVQSIENYAQTLLTNGIPRENVRNLVLEYAQSFETAAGRMTNATHRDSMRQQVTQMRSRWPENP